MPSWKRNAPAFRMRQSGSGMNYRPSAPGASGLVCSGARLVITTAQLRESPRRSRRSRRGQRASVRWRGGSGGRLETVVAQGVQGMTYSYLALAVQEPSGWVPVFISVLALIATLGNYLVTLWRGREHVRLT